MYRLIIVDDEQIVRESLRSLFDWGQMGFEVVGLFEDGTDAADYLRANAVDAILADVRMYEMSGLELARFARELDSRIRVVMLSSYQEFDYVRDAMRYGVCDYLLKPIGAEELMRAFDKVRAQLDAGRRDELAEMSAAFGRDCLALDETAYEKRRGEWLLALAGVTPSVRQSAIRLLFDALYAGAQTVPFPPALEKRALTEGYGLGSDEGDVLAACDALAELRDSLTRDKRANLAEKVAEYVDANIGRDFTVEDVAQSLYFSAGYLSREFKRLTGENLSDYMTRRRMNRAMELMRVKRYPAAQLAAMVGYNDAHYFQRAFKKYSGLTLREWCERNGAAR